MSPLGCSWSVPVPRAASLPVASSSIVAASLYSFALATFGPSSTPSCSPASVASAARKPCWGWKVKLVWHNQMDWELAGQNRVSADPRTMRLSLEDSSPFQTVSYRKRFVHPLKLERPRI